MKHCQYKTEGFTCGGRVILLADKTRPLERVEMPRGGFVWMYPLIQGERCYFHDKVRHGTIAKTDYFTR